MEIEFTEDPQLPMGTGIFFSTKVQISTAKAKSKSNPVNTDRIKDLHGTMANVVPKWLLRGRGIPLSYRDRGNERALSMDLPINFDSAYLVPDLEALRLLTKLKKLKLPSFKIHHEEFNRRQKIIYWRGSTTGMGRIDTVEKLSIIPRVKICFSSLSCRLYDLKISALVQSESTVEKDLKHWLIERNIFSEYTPPDTFYNYYATIMIPGNASPWGVLEKMYNGLLIIKPRQEYQTLFASLMKDNHCVPLIDYSTNSLESTATWCSLHEQETSKIAWRGRVLAYSYLCNLKIICIAKMLLAKHGLANKYLLRSIHEIFKIYLFAFYWFYMCKRHLQS